MAMNIELLTLPQSRYLPGLRFRSARIPEDTAAMAQIYNRYYASLGLQKHMSAEMLQHIFEHHTLHDLQRDLIIVDLDRQPIAYASISCNDQTDGIRNVSQ